jgi:glycosyltransferase involved in cell wall biosynthesis
MNVMRHDIALYTSSAFTAGFYDRTRGRAGGAERQMTLLARALAARGRRVAHIVYPPADPVVLPEGLTLVPRASYAGGRARGGGVLEAVRIWRALGAADARVVIVRTASPVVGVAAAWAKLHRRRMIFSSANNFDFALDRISSRAHRALYRLGVRLADAVVVQSEDQLALAARAFPSLRRLVQIPSFAELTPPAAAADRDRPDSFLWFARLVDYKQPLLYVELARAVPDARFRMIPVPEKPSPALAALHAAARAAPNLDVLEPVRHEHLSELIRRAAAVVNTSTFEGMPNAFLEAWAHGVPVLTLQFDPDGVVERNGLGVSAGGSWERFVDGARELWKARDRRDELSRRVRSYVETIHSSDAIGARWGALIGELAPDLEPRDSQSRRGGR